MKVSQLLTKTSKDAPADEHAKNAQLLIRAGYVHKEMAGVYTFLPLGLKVLNNISQIVREEMDAAGGQGILARAGPRQNDTYGPLVKRDRGQQGASAGLGAGGLPETGYRCSITAAIDER